MIIPLQNTTITAMINITIQPQNTTMVSNIFNLTSQLMGTITEVTAGGSNQQNNTTSTGNIEGGYFSHFGIIGANLFRRGFKTFEGNNNNNSPSENNNNNPPSGNNNNNLPLLLPPEFREGLGGGFNLPSGKNAGGLDPNIVALINILTGANLEINQVEKESNHVKLTEFGRMEAEDPNE